MSKTRAYMRVSTQKQDLENQRLEILKLANDRGLGQVEFFQEEISGRKSWRDRLLFQVIDEMAEGDVLIVAELSRLGRSMFEIMEILSLATQRHIKIYASKGNWELNGDLQGKLLAMVMAMAAEIERDLISQRTKAALATRKARGIRLGRPKGPGRSKLDERRDEIQDLLNLGVTQRRIAEKMGTSYRNLGHWMAKREIKRQK